MQYFGDPWDAPVCDPDDEASVDQAPTPVGDPCLDCDVPIAEGDQGVIFPYAPADGPPRMGAHHRRCFLRSILGPHVHLDGFLK